MKLPFQPNLIHPNFFQHYNNPIEINFGDCFKWAFIAYRLFNDVELWSHEIHAFIKYRGRFYDSETLDGIKNWRRIRTIKEIGGGFPSARKMSVSEYLPYWQVHDKCNWNALNVKIDFFSKSLFFKENGFV